MRELSCRPRTLAIQAPARFQIGRSISGDTFTVRFKITVKGTCCEAALPAHYTFM